jgi:hypothetical protein
MIEHSVLRSQKAALAVLSLAACLLCTGCPPPPKVQPAPPELPPRSLDDIVVTIEANAAKLNQALWSNSVAVTARFTDQRGKEHVYNLDSNFLFRPPQCLRMDLRPSMGDQVMQIGSNDADYWAWIEPELHTMWWGRYVHVGKPCATTIAVRPNQLVAALGLGGLPSPSEHLIGPIRKYGRTFDILYYLREEPSAISPQLSAEENAPPTGPAQHSTLTTQDSALSTQDSFLIDREYWVERVPPYLVRVVEFRDRLGRVTTSAFLDDYRAAWEGGPLVPHAVSIIWHQDNGKFTMTIGRAQGLPLEKAPPEKFRRPTRDDLPAGVTEIVQVDADCDVVFNRGEEASSESPTPAGLPSAPPAPRHPASLPRQTPSSIWIAPDAASAPSWVPPPSSAPADWLAPQPSVGVRQSLPGKPRR